MVLRREFVYSTFKAVRNRCFNKNLLSRRCFLCSHASILLQFLLFLFDFLNRIFLNGFPNPFIVHSRPSFLFETKFLCR